MVEKKDMKAYWLMIKLEFSSHEGKQIHMSSPCSTHGIIDCNFKGTYAVFCCCGCYFVCLSILELINWIISNSVWDDELVKNCKSSKFVDYLWENFGIPGKCQAVLP